MYIYIYNIGQTFPKSGKNRFWVKSWFYGFYNLFNRFGMLDWICNGYNIHNPFMNCEIHIFSDPSSTNGFLMRTTIYTE